MADAKTAILITLDLAHEGGFQKNPNDRANWTGGQVGVGTLVGTNGGITALDMPGVDIEHLTIDQKIAYYLEHYWKPLYSSIAWQPLANKLFDWAFCSGSERR
jgi:lysozyme family protein